jgi:hypothetical protein
LFGNPNVKCAIGKLAPQTHTSQNSHVRKKKRIIIMI